MQCFKYISELWISVKLSREYFVHLNWIKPTSNPCRLDNSKGRATDWYPEGASSNPAPVYIFQLTSAVSDYHEKFLFMNISEDDSEIKLAQKANMDY